MTHPTDALRLVPRRAVYDWIRDDVPLNVKLTITPQHVDALLSRLSKAAPASPLPEGGAQLSKNLGQLKSPDLDALEKLADEAGGKSWTLGGGGFVVDGDQPIADFLAQSDPDDWKSAPSLGDAFRRAKFSAASNPATIKALIAELKALQAFAADEISWAFCAGFKDAIAREKWDDCYDFAAAKAGDYRNDRIRAFLARNGKADLQKMQNNAPRNAPRGLSDEC